MEKDTVDRIAFMASRFASVLVALTGLQTLCGAVAAQMGPFAAFVALVCVSLSWQAQLLRVLLWQRLRLFVVIAALCVAVMVAAFGASVSIPSPSTPSPLG